MLNSWGGALLWFSFPSVNLLGTYRSLDNPKTAITEKSHPGLKADFPMAALQLTFHTPASFGFCCNLFQGRVSCITEPKLS